jgi:general secretion pathway protein N
VQTRWRWLALGVGAYLAFVLVSFPAGTAYAWFAPAELVLTGIQGTLWKGRAAGGTVGGLALRDINWDVHVLRLLIGRLSAEIRAQLSDGGVSANVTVTPSRVAMTDVRASTSLPTLRAVLPVSGTQGQANVSLSRLELDDGRLVEVIGELNLAQLEITPLISTGPRRLVPIGNYAIQFLESSGKGVNATFRDTGGPLEVTGTLVVDNARAYTLDGMIKPRADAPQELLDGIAVITADPDAAGRRRITLTGSL